MGDLGHDKVFWVELPATPSGASIKGGYAVLEVEETIPYALTGQHAASLAQSLPNGRLLFTQNSLTTPNNLWLLSGLDRPNEPLKLKQISHFAETHLQGLGLSSAEEFWFEGAKGAQVHGFALKPKGWEEGKKKAYPAVLLIHGGPQGAWEDAWSTRWNPNGMYLVWCGNFSIHLRFFQSLLIKATLPSSSTRAARRPTGKVSTGRSRL